jgi:transcriptional regulator with XRE-family HTH domain
MDIRNNIKIIRERLGLSQYELAFRLNLDQSSYSRLEKRGNKLSIEQIKTISDAMKVDVKEILGYGDDSSSILSVSTLELKVKELNENLIFYKNIAENNQTLIEFKNKNLMSAELYFINIFESVFLTVLYAEKKGMICLGNVSDVDYKEFKVSNFNSYEEMLSFFEGITSTLPLERIKIVLTYEEEIEVLDAEVLYKNPMGRVFINLLLYEFEIKKYSNLMNDFKNRNLRFLQKLKIVSLEFKIVKLKNYLN